MLLRKPVSFTLCTVALLLLCHSCCMVLSQESCSNPAAESSTEEAGPTSGCGCGSAALNRDNYQTKDSDASVATEDAEGGESETVDSKEAAEKYTEEANMESNSEELPRTNQMLKIEGGEFIMGRTHPIIPADGESPARDVVLDTFWLDVHEVSNAEFARFVKDTGYVTEAETFGDSFCLELFVEREVLEKTEQAVAEAMWWVLVKGANWKSPNAGTSKMEDFLDHPVVHVSWNDAVAYCKWADKRLPTEAEFEYACRSGKKGKLRPWGNSEKPRDQHRMNFWQGDFPNANTAEDGYNASAPVTAYLPQNKAGLKNIVGNVWEWVSDWWTVNHVATDKPIANPKGPKTGTDKVKKGGSYLCTTQYCFRHRCDARSQNTPDSSAVNLGFRCAADKLPQYLENNNEIPK